MESHTVFGHIFSSKRSIFLRFYFRLPEQNLIWEIEDAAVLKPTWICIPLKQRYTSRMKIWSIELFGLTETRLPQNLKV